MNDPINVPPSLLRVIIQRKHDADKAQGRVDGAVEAAQAALGVPNGWTLDMATGSFTPPSDGDD